MTLLPAEQFFYRNNIDEVLSHYFHLTLDVSFMDGFDNQTLVDIQAFADRFLDEGESIDDYLEYQAANYSGSGESFRLVASQYQGHPIAALMTGDTMTIFTPTGEKLSDLNLVNLKSLFTGGGQIADPFTVTTEEIKSRVIYHGTSQDHADSIYTSGLDYDKMFVGNVGKALYTTQHLEYAMGYSYAEESSQYAGHVLAMQFLPDANIVDDRSCDRFHELLSNHNADPNFNQIMIDAGIDAVYTPSMDLVAIFNKDCILSLGYASKEEIGYWLKEKNNPTAIRSAFI